MSTCLECIAFHVSMIGQANTLIVTSPTKILVWDLGVECVISKIELICYRVRKPITV